MLGDDFKENDTITGDDGTTYYIKEVLNVTSRFKIIKMGSATRAESALYYNENANPGAYDLTGSELRTVVTKIDGMQSPTTSFSVSNQYSDNFYVVYNENVTRGQVFTASDGNKYVATSAASLSKSFSIATSQGGTPLYYTQLQGVLNNFSKPYITFTTIQYNVDVTVGQEIQDSQKRWVLDDATAGKPFRISTTPSPFAEIKDLSSEYTRITDSSITHISAEETVNTPTLPNLKSGATITIGGESLTVLNKNDAIHPSYSNDHFVTTNIFEMLGSNKSGYCVKSDNGLIISWTSASEEQMGAYWWNNSSGTSEWEKTKEAYINYDIFAPQDGLGGFNLEYENSVTLHSTDHSFALEYLSTIDQGPNSGAATRNVYCFGHWKTGAVDVKYDGSGKLNSNVKQGKIVPNVEKVFATDRAFAVIKTDGSLECWGDPEYGGMYQGRDGDDNSNEDGSTYTWAKSSLVDINSDNFYKIKNIFSTKRSFAALRENNTVISWGSNQYGGNKNELDKIINLKSNDIGFSAINENGELITWGYNNDFNSNMQASNENNNNNNNDGNNNDGNSNNDPFPPPPENGGQDSGYIDTNNNPPDGDDYGNGPPDGDDYGNGPPEGVDEGNTDQNSGNTGYNDESTNGGY